MAAHDSDAVVPPGGITWRLFAAALHQGTNSLELPALDLAHQVLVDRPPRSVIFVLPN